MMKYDSMTCPVTQGFEFYQDARCPEGLNRIPQFLWENAGCVPEVLSNAAVSAT
jgi:hypothetical protein